MAQLNNPKILSCNTKNKDCMNSFLTLLINVHLSGDPVVHKLCPLYWPVYFRSFTPGAVKYIRRGYLAKIHVTVPPCVIEQWRLLLKSHTLRRYDYVQESLLVHPSSNQ